MSRLRGFTLIELLVVVAIIGLLASIIVASLESARAKGADAAARGTLDQARKEIEIVATPGNYGAPYFSGPCPQSSNPPDPIFYTDVQLRGMIASLIARGIDVQCAAGTLADSGNATSWAIAASLKTTSQYYWCVDGSGNAETTPVIGFLKELFGEIAQVFVPVAHALLGGPVFLGGGYGTPAGCP